MQQDSLFQLLICMLCYSKDDSRAVTHLQQWSLQLTCNDLHLLPIRTCKPLPDKEHGKASVTAWCNAGQVCSHLQVKKWQLK